MKIGIDARFYAKAGPGRYTKSIIQHLEKVDKKNDYVTAFAALNYAHGWLDVGSKLGIFNVKNDKLFVIK